ncbi:hypothetical protein FWH13_02665 [Candidatus Saccharibacteria bacterium]|nr:hypothetical protein [Candidatus Saccharibacteria bacterium]
MDKKRIIIIATILLGLVLMVPLLRQILNTGSSSPDDDTSGQGSHEGLWSYDGYGGHDNWYAHLSELFPTLTIAPGQEQVLGPYSPYPDRDEICASYATVVQEEFMALPTFGGLWVDYTGLVHVQVVDGMSASALTRNAVSAQIASLNAARCFTVTSVNNTYAALGQANAAIAEILQRRHELTLDGRSISVSTRVDINRVVVDVPHEIHFTYNRYLSLREILERFGSDLVVFVVSDSYTPTTTP